MVDYEYKNLFEKRNVDKQFHIYSENKEIDITNSELHLQKFELTESLCSDEELIFGSCEAGMVKFTISNTFVAMKGKEMTVSIVLNNHVENPFIVGKYKVFSDVPSADRSKREITAYDSMYDIINSDVANWYNTILPDENSTVTLKQFRQSFIAHFGLSETVPSGGLVNDNMIVRKTIEPSELSGKTVITAVCEINGCFGHIGRDGKFHYIYLEQNMQGLYPSNDLFPNHAPEHLPEAEVGTLYPHDPKGTKIQESLYIKANYEDFVVKTINKLQIRQEENNAVITVGNGNNCYAIKDNFLVYKKGENELLVIAENIFEKIKDVIYRPFSAECVGNPCLEAGDPIRLNTKYEIIESYVLKRILKGTQSMRDNYSSTGREIRSQNLNSISENIIQLNGKTSTLERNIEETKSTMVDLGENLESQIMQTTEEIAAKVSKGDVVSEINLSSEQILLKGNRLVVESTNFELDKNGNVKLSGDLVSKGALKVSGSGFTGSISADTGNFSLRNIYGQDGNIYMETVHYNNQKALKIESSTDALILPKLSLGQTMELDESIYSPQMSSEQNCCGGDLYVGQSTYLNSSPIITSDLNEKTEVSELDVGKSSDFIYSLVPVKFKYKVNQSERYHHGLIAQQVKQAMGDDDWGVYCDKGIDSTDSEGKSIRYEELIADLIAALKSQNDRIKELERRMDKYE